MTAAAGPGPVDRLVDRRSFLVRAAAVAGTTAAGAAALPSIAYAGAPAQPPGGFRGTRGTPYRPPRPEALRDITELTIAEAAWLIRAGRLDPERLVEAYLDRIGVVEPVYQAFNLVAGDRALAEARRLGRRGPRTPLRGIPLAVKDNYWTAGLRTTANSYLFQDFVPPSDATAVARLRAAGGIVLGKTQMGPLATTRATAPNGVITTVSAWAPTDPSVDPGGSSTGSATAVAGRLATSGTGTQTGGSITGPSNAQNLTGLKPTMGRVSLYGIIPLSYTRDHPGPLARDAMDAAIMLTAMAGPDRRDPRTQGLPPVGDLVAAATPVRANRRPRLRWRTRVGVIPGYTAGATPTAAARRAFLAALDAIPGASLVDVPLPAEWELLTGPEFNNVRLPERSEPFKPYLRTDLRAFGVSVTGWLQGALLGADEYLTGQRAKLVLLERVLDLFDRCDVVVQTGPLPFDIIGLPELALPIGFTAAGLPIGTILGAPPYAEDRLLAVAAAYQDVTDWHLRRPADPPATADGRAPRTARRDWRTATAAAPDPRRGRLTAEEVVRRMQ
ncbi:amidase [Spirilliplanes yamanashiensis]|uniref:Glutamyl-tRNA(Gln) amidotransferase subunit A n=1 Tax=Spirilliplanes yamanashiensis TaxID=42233 RepID=A0A8J3YAL6_9ACTN|nr:amidase [Spirilliplanes yamanashiensis]MDP9818172.1 aspartyl-tRNA(Asn)/glutamyl-tRNA(Gln) amidotransferase subunit A [Spirilliplanes yamanashiensis]GIJ04983.1 glutamyl-tRNA(Gln) amidotransferase subunit A [Spirilliplanes yamanashiensis]